MGNGNGEMTGGNYYRRNECASTQRQRAVTTRHLKSNKRQATEMLAGRLSRAFPLSFQGLFPPFSSLSLSSLISNLSTLYSASFFLYWILPSPHFYLPFMAYVLEVYILLFLQKKIEGWNLLMLWIRFEYIFSIRFIWFSSFWLLYAGFFPLLTKWLNFIPTYNKNFINLTVYF